MAQNTTFQCCNQWIWNYQNFHGVLYHNVLDVANCSFP